MNETGRLCELAALYALGSLEGDEAREFAAHLETCEDCAREVRAFGETAAQLAVTAAMRPPDGLRERVLERVLSESPGRVLVRRDDGAWKDTGFPGVMAKTLFFDRASGNITSLVKVGPGAFYPRHVHAGFEQLFVLEGDLTFEDHVLRAGDYEVMGMESRHPSATSVEGCTVLIIHNVNDEVLA